MSKRQGRGKGLGRGPGACDGHRRPGRRAPPPAGTAAPGHAAHATAPDGEASQTTETHPGSDVVNIYLKNTTEKRCGFKNTVMYRNKMY